MTEYKQLLKTLFNSYTKTHELSSRIVDPQLRRNHIKKNEGNYRVLILLDRDFKTKLFTDTNLKNRSIMDWFAITII